MELTFSMECSSAVLGKKDMIDVLGNIDNDIDFFSKIC